MIQWVYWQAANVGPNFGNKLSYTRYMDDVPEAAKAHPKERFLKESLRLMGALERRLKGRSYVCGEELTIADIAIYPWVRGWKWSKVPIVDLPDVVTWVKRVRARPGVDRGLKVGIPADEVDQWSEERKRRTAQGGQSIASNERLRSTL